MAMSDVACNPRLTRPIETSKAAAQPLVAGGGWFPATTAVDASQRISLRQGSGQPRPTCKACRAIRFASSASGIPARIDPPALRQGTPRRSEKPGHARTHLAEQPNPGSGQAKPAWVAAAHGGPGEENG